jgi:nitrite reductase/ring-hydroxylating ferredoxin subunit
MTQQLVTHVGAVTSGAVAAFDVAGRRIAVANVGGRFFAFDDACTHRQCSLANGRLSGPARVTGAYST